MTAILDIQAGKCGTRYRLRAHLGAERAEVPLDVEEANGGVDTVRSRTLSSQGNLDMARDLVQQVSATPEPEAPE
ncbi:MAG: hypothetical protein ACYCZY_10965 [Lacisediminihabitans sp.]